MRVTLSLNRTSVQWQLGQEQLPLFVQGMNLEAATATVAIIPAAGSSAGTFSLQIDNRTLGSFLPA